MRRPLPGRLRGAEREQQLSNNAFSTALLTPSPCRAQTKIRDTLNNLILKSPQNWQTSVGLPFFQIEGTVRPAQHIGTPFLPQVLPTRAHHCVSLLAGRRVGRGQVRRPPDAACAVRGRLPHADEPAPKAQGSRRASRPRSDHRVRLREFPAALNPHPQARLTPVPLAYAQYATDAGRQHFADRKCHASNPTTSPLNSRGDFCVCRAHVDPVLRPGDVQYAPRFEHAHIPRPWYPLLIPMPVPAKTLTSSTPTSRRPTTTSPVRRPPLEPSLLSH